MAVNQVKSTKNYVGRIKVWAVVNGEELDVSSFRIRYAINEIPVGNLTFNLGINAVTGRSAAIQSLKGIDNQTKIEVWTEIKASANAIADKKIPNGKFKIFEGYTAGTEGFRKSANGNIEFGVGVLGWLFDLNNSSVLSGRFFADTPIQIFRVFDANTTSATDNQGRPQYNILGMASALTDFVQKPWRNISSILANICETELVGKWREIGSANKAALKALGRITGSDIKGSSSAANKIVEGKLLFEKIIKSSLLNQAVAANALTNIFSVQGLTGSSVWDKILQLASTFQFYLIPNVEAATCVPLVFQNKNIYKTITADECFEIDIQASAPQQIAGLILLNSATTTTNAFSNPESVLYPVFASDPKLLLGPKKASEIPGKILVREMPDFFRSAPVASGWASPVINSQKVEGKGLDEAKKKDEEGRKRHEEMQLSDLGNQIATNWFYNELYKGRIGNLTSPLRFDIGPGSSVKLSGIGEKTPNFSRNIYSCVVSVTLNFSADPGQAFTQFTLAHCRSETEKDNSLDKSPIYADKWFGTYLVKQ
jgi:hypothetical protein